MNPLRRIPIERYAGQVPAPFAVYRPAGIGALRQFPAQMFGIAHESGAADAPPPAPATGAPPAIETRSPALVRLVTARDVALEQGQGLVATAERENRDLTPSELEQVTAASAEAARRDAQIVEIDGLEQRAARAAEQRARFATAITPAVQVTRNESAYRPNGGQSFFRDVLAASMGQDPEAAERLRRNNLEGEERERRDGTTGSTSMGSFIPPIWLVDQLAQTARVGRVLAPFMAPGGFPTTNSITIPRITTGSSEAGQAGDNAVVSETDIITAQLTRTTVTIAGQQDVSIQSIDLSPFPVDQIVFADLNGAYQAELDRQIMRGSGTNELLGLNQVASINTVTYTDASPTAPELFPKFGDAAQQIHSNRFAPAQIVSMHPRRWAWISTAVDSSGRPLGIPAGGAAFNPIATFGEVAAQGIVGLLSNGLPVVATGSHATNLGGGTEDQIVVCRPSDCILMESPIRTRILQEVLSGNLTVRLQLYAYVNFFAGRFPKSISTIGGTGLAAPTF